MSLLFNAAAERYPTPASLPLSLSPSPSLSLKEGKNENADMIGKMRPRENLHLDPDTLNPPSLPVRPTYRPISPPPPPPPPILDHDYSAARAGRQAGGGYQEAVHHGPRGYPYEVAYSGGINGEIGGYGAQSGQHQHQYYSQSGEQQWRGQEGAAREQEGAGHYARSAASSLEAAQGQSYYRDYYSSIGQDYSQSYVHDYGVGQRYDPHSAHAHAYAQPQQWRPIQNLTLPTQPLPGTVEPAKSAGSQLNASSHDFVPGRSVYSRLLDRCIRVDRRGRYNTRSAARKQREASDSPALSRPQIRSKKSEKKQAPKLTPEQASLRPFERAAALSPSPEPQAATAALIARRNKGVARMQVMERPTPTPYYLVTASQQLETLKAPKKLLVVLDLNGTLLFRKKFHGNNNFIPRWGLGEFLNYLFTNHKVMVWSSARPQNVATMCNQLFNETESEQLVAIWARDTLRIPPQHYNDKVQVYKQLSWIWNDTKLQVSSQGGDMWTQNNTVLIDDTLEKAASEPHNIVQIEEFEAREDQMRADVLGQVTAYLEQLKWQANASAYMRAQPFQYDASLDAAVGQSQENGGDGSYV